MKEKDYRKALSDLVPQSQGIETIVLQDALDSEDAASYLEDVLQHGCQSGIVGRLIYYTDTKQFFTDHLDDIEELKHELEESMGEPLKIGEPMYNWLAWFGYEETARKLADKIGLEV